LCPAPHFAAGICVLDFLRGLKAADSAFACAHGGLQRESRLGMGRPAYPLCCFLRQQQIKSCNVERAIQLLY
jgi:hypothetical protein